MVSIQERKPDQVSSRQPSRGSSSWWRRPVRAVAPHAILRALLLVSGGGLLVASGTPTEDPCLKWSAQFLATPADEWMDFEPIKHRVNRVLPSNNFVWLDTQRRHIGLKSKIRKFFKFGRGEIDMSTQRRGGDPRTLVPLKTYQTAFGFFLNICRPLVRRKLVDVETMKLKDSVEKSIIISGPLIPNFRVGSLKDLTHQVLPAAFVLHLATNDPGERVRRLLSPTDLQHSAAITNQVLQQCLGFKEPTMGHPRWSTKSDRREVAERAAFKRATDVYEKMESQGDGVSGNALADHCDGDLLSALMWDPFMGAFGTSLASLEYLLLTTPSDLRLKWNKMLAREATTEREEKSLQLLNSNVAVAVERWIRRAYDHAAWQSVDPDPEFIDSCPVSLHRFKHVFAPPPKFFAHAHSDGY